MNGKAFEFLVYRKSPLIYTNMSLLSDFAPKTHRHILLNVNLVGKSSS